MCRRDNRMLEVGFAIEGRWSEIGGRGGVEGARVWLGVVARNAGGVWILSWLEKPYKCLEVAFQVGCGVEGLGMYEPQVQRRRRDSALATWKCIQRSKR